MKRQVLRWLKKILRFFRIKVSSIEDIKFLLSLGFYRLIRTHALLLESRSQLKQDLFVLAETGFKEHGYFVEFGATDGIELSNTYLLETKFSWTGILAEPAKIWQAKLERNRPSASIEKLCIWSDSFSELRFNEVKEAVLSTISIFSDSDNHSTSRESGKEYNVKTISLIDLLRKYNAPKHIDYLSIDTEGSEYDILSKFDFSEYSFGIITVEHNYTTQRDKIFNLLLQNGYKRKYEHLSHFDDWYTK